MSWDYIYGIRQYKVFSILELFESKTISEEITCKIWVMFKVINKGKDQQKFLFSYKGKSLSSRDVFFTTIVLLQLWSMVEHL